MRRTALLLFCCSNLLLAQQPPRSELDADRKPKTRTGGNVLLENAVLHTPAGRVKGALLVRDGLIVALGAKVEAPPGVKRIDLGGQHVIPGVIDCHSHIAIEGGVNEPRDTITAEVRIADSVNHRDVSIYRALAGGTTTANLLHGSANPIGGQNAVIKLRYGRPARELVYRKAPRGIKFALGENVVRGGDFPGTRMGVEATMRRAFGAARRYQAEWQAYEKQRERGKPAYPPRRDLRLETLAGVLEGKVLVHCHCYRADEIQMMLRVADEFGFKVRTLQHVLEGYKVAPEIARHGAGASTFSDWWGYKVEAYDAIPYNAAFLLRAGVLTSINSDSNDLIRRLPLEAAKSIRWGGLSEIEALSLVTINPARQLGIERWTGSLELGKEADLAVFSGHPFDVRSRCTMTLIEGELYFERPASGKPPAFRIPPRRERLPLPRPARSYAVVGATVHTGAGRAIERGVVLVEGNRITAVGGPELAVPAGATSIDGRGLQLYPGLINAWTQIGLNEIGSLDETQDHRDRGPFKPDLAAITAINPESAHIEVARSGGVTLALAAPGGGTISGQAALVQLDGWTPPQMALLPRAGLVLAFPFAPKKAKTNKKLEQLERLLDHARHYGRLRKAARDGTIEPVPKNLQYEALLPYVEGRATVFVQAGRKATIEQALAFARKQKLRIVIAGGKEADQVAGLLAREKVPVIYDAVYSQPRERHTPYDANFATPAALARAGVRFCIASGGSSQARNVGFHAGMAWGHGLSAEQALAAVTIDAARILGVEKLAGSIEPGKRADLVLCTGNPLQITSQIVGLLIGGKPVSLENRHTRLYEKYLRRSK